MKKEYKRIKVLGSTKEKERQDGVKKEGKKKERNWDK